MTLSETILLVEDNPDDVFMIQRAHRKLGLAHSIQVVDNGDEAISYLSGAGKYMDRELYPLPSVVLLDLKLPRKSGHEVLSWIRAQAHLRGIPVVILTSSRENIDISRAYEMHVNSYLVKPVSLDDMQEMLHAVERYWLTLNQKPLPS